MEVLRAPPLVRFSVPPCSLEATSYSVDAPSQAALLPFLV